MFAMYLILLIRSHILLLSITFCAFNMLFLNDYAFILKFKKKKTHTTLVCVEARQEGILPSCKPFWMLYMQKYSIHGQAEELGQLFKIYYWEEITGFLVTLPLASSFTDNIIISYKITLFKMES